MKNILSLASLLLTVFLLFVSIDASSANTPLGRVTLIGADGGTDIYNLSSGDKLTYGQKALIRTTGATFVAEKGSDLEVMGQKGHLTLQIEKGVIHFRIQPHKTLISFNTKNGNFKTPGIVKASTSIVEGTIMVNEDETILEIVEGSLQALTDNGVETVNAGDKLLIVSQGALEEDVEQNGGTKEVADNGNDASGEGGDDDPSLAGPAIIGGVGAVAITGAIIGASTSGNGGDNVSSPIQ